KCGQGELGSGEEQVAIASLEAYLALQSDTRTGAAPPRPLAERPVEPIGERVRRSAAPHAFAMSDENQGGDVGEAVCLHRIRQPALKSLDREACRNLADESTRVRKSGLDGDPPASAHVVAIHLLAEQGVDQATSVLEGLF